MDKHSLTPYIKAEAKRLGFDVCGIAKAEPVPSKVASAFKKWVTEGRQATMGYMANHLEKRLDPTLLVEGTQSIICLAMNYHPLQEMKGYELAWYAYGKDYHEVMKQHLFLLLEAIKQTAPEADGRCFCDTAPVLERYWAEKAGLGWRGKNTQLIIPHQGTAFFLGEIFLNLELEYDEPVKNGCGNCHACQDLCPMQALYTDAESGIPMLDANRCLSYQTIENRGEISQEAKLKMGNRIYGCDQCQKACPHNRFSTPTSHEEFLPSCELMEMTPEDWDQLTQEKYQQLFKGSAVKRAKYDGLVRNIKAVKENH